MLPVFQTILYATDLGHHAPEVFRYALSLARRYRATIHVVHAIEPLGAAARHVVELYAPGKFSEEIERSRWEALVSDVRERVTRLCRADLCQAEDGSSLIRGVEVVAGKPAEAILGQARRVAADIIVMGAHGHSTVGEILLGSTAHRVVHKATVPVLLVRVSEGEAADGV